MYTCACIYVSLGQTEICADEQGLLSSGLRNREAGQSLTLCRSVLVGGCQERLWGKHRTSQIPKFPKGHAAKNTNHKCLAPSNRFRTPCMSKQTQQCLWVRLHYIYICFGISYFKLDINNPFSCECYDNNTLWKIFCIENVLFCTLAK